MIHKALDLAELGDTVVFDGCGSLTAVGGLLVRRASTDRISGLVLHGAIRDSGPTYQVDFPIYATRGRHKDGPEEIEDSMVTQPGDLMIVDEDGLVCVHHDEVETVCAATVVKHRAERQQRRSAKDAQSGRG